MRIEIWSDVVCPWCSIGRSRLDRAIADFDHRDDVEIVYRSFQLDPGASREPTLTAPEHLGRKYGGGVANGRAMVDRVEAVAAEEGMVWRHHESRPVNTLDAHRLLHLALAEAGSAVQAVLKEALFAAYFSEARNVADHDVLREVAVGVGLDPARVDAVLAGKEFREEVFADQDRAAAYGAGGVPFFVVDGRYGISGAQPAATFGQVLERAWAESHPVIEMVGAGRDAGGACGPDGCAT
jgi:predicted DsbA family dithiol-disulfide isomerase